MAPKGLVKDLANAADPSAADVPLRAVIGHVAWMMCHAQTHKRLFLVDLEWAVLAPVGFGQFRL
jgi:hemolysin-activating ACP:hemolysin acyltransferase